MKRSVTSSIAAALVLMLSSLAMAQTAEEPIPSAPGDLEEFALEPNSWLSAGHDLHNTRSAPAERIIGPQNVRELVPKWIYTTHGNVSANPAVQGDALYACDFGGYLFKVNAQTGQEVWARKITDYDGIPDSLCRLTPAIGGDKLIIGDQVNGAGFQGSSNGQNVMAINKKTGALLWKTRVDTHPAAIITSSPVIQGGRIYIGVSSGEEGFTANPNYVCCSFRGSVVALDLETGAILWKTYMVPANYSGGAVWSSTPVVDLKRGSLYVTTGNNYSVPASVTACTTSAGSNLAAQNACLAPDDFMDAVVALDLSTGRIKWGHRLQEFDVWTVLCFSMACPMGPDYDFGAGANLFTVGTGAYKRDLLGAGQKSGIYWALDPDNGKIVWARSVGPGSVFGGVEWGTATDGKRVYVANSNFGRQSHTLKSGQTITWGSYSALDAATGQIIWQIPDPTQSFPVGAVTVANGVLYAESIDPNGPLYAFDAATGSVLWKFNTIGSAMGAASIVNGTVYWGSGYERFRIPLFVGGANKLYAFGLPQH